MHNIFLGVAKHTVKLWKEKKILTMNDFELLQNRVDSMNPPPNLGWIPRKIESSFASFTADEWKHWILVYSLFALHGILPQRHYSSWQYFVEACMLLCQMTITKVEVISAHELLLKFCKTFEDLYGAEKCTPNMHMACHLKECVFDYGPLLRFGVSLSNDIMEQWRECHCCGLDQKSRCSQSSLTYNTFIVLWLIPTSVPMVISWE